MPFSSPRVKLLRVFGARIGHGVIVRPGVRVKNPWALAVGDYSMIGEEAWIDNLVPVTIGANVCISQGAYLCTGNHDWSSPSFRYRLGKIHVADGAWVGAHATIGPNINIGEAGVVALGSVVVQDVPAYEVHAGNPASFKKQRVFRPDTPNTQPPRKPALRW
jgi:putative colanic acid biosynthesis acetyltransferase WcaF